MITRLPESRAMRVVAATNRRRDAGKPGHSQKRKAMAVKRCPNEEG